MRQLPEKKQQKRKNTGCLHGFADIGKWRKITALLLAAALSVPLKMQFPGTLHRVQYDLCGTLEGADRAGSRSYPVPRRLRKTGAGGCQRPGSRCGNAGAGI